MKNKIKIFAFVSILLIALSLISLIGLYQYTTVIDSFIEYVVNRNLPAGLRLNFDDIRGNLIYKIRVDSLRLTSEKWRATSPFISIDYNLFDILKSSYNIDKLVISTPEFSLETNENKSTTNADTLGIPQRIMAILKDSLFLKMPSARINELIIKDGSVDIISGENQENIHSINMEARASLSAENISVSLVKLNCLWKNRDIPLEQMGFRITGNRKKITLNQCKIKSEATSLHLHGEVDFKRELPTLYFFVDTSEVDLSIFQRIARLPDSLVGKVRFACDFIGNRNEFTGKLYLGGNKDSLQVENFRGKFKLRDNSLYFSEINMRSNFGRLSGDAMLARFKKNKIDFNFNRIDLGKLGVATTKTEITGHISLTFNSWNLHKITGNGRLYLNNLKIAQARVDTVQLRLSAANGNWVVAKNSRFVVDRASKFFIDGTLDNEGLLYLHLETDENNLDTLDAKLGLGFLGGSGSLDLILAGKYDNPDLFGYFLLDSLSIKDRPAYGIEGRIELIGLLRERIGYFVLDLSSANINNIEVTDGLVQTKVNGDIVTIDSLSFYNYDNYFNTHGTVTLGPDTQFIDLDKFMVSYKNFRIFAPENIQLYYSQDSLAIHNFYLQTNYGGEIEARGGANFSRDLNLGLYLDQVHLSPFNQFHALDYDFKGQFFASVEAMGSLEKPSIDIDMGVNNLSIGPDYVGTVATELSLNDTRIDLNRLIVSDSQNVRLFADGNFYFNKDSLELTENNLNLEVSRFDFSALSFAQNLNFPLTGILDAKIQLAGNLTAPNGKIQLRGENVQLKQYFIPNVSLLGHISPEQLIFEDVTLNLNNSTININGHKNISWEIDSLKTFFDSPGLSLNLSMREDSLNFLKYINPEIDILTGEITADLKLSGKLSNPTLDSGNLTIKDGNLYLTKIENPLENLNGDIHFENNEVDIRQFKGVFRRESKSQNIFAKISRIIKYPFQKLFGDPESESYVSLSGKVNMEDIFRPRLYLSADIKNTYINYYLENTKLIFSSEKLTIVGQDTIQILGGIEVHRGEVNIDIAESEKNLLLTPNLRERPPYLHYLLGIKLPSNFYVRSESALNTFDLQLKGEISVLQEPKSVLEIYGELYIENGKYFQFEEFDITEGKLKFTNPKELPEIEITAEKQKYDYLFKLKVQGSLQNPTKEIQIFDLVTGEDKTYLYPETKDQIALLLFGVTFKELSSGSSKLLLEKGQDILNRAVLSRVESEARRFTGLDQIRLESGDESADKLNQSSKSSRLSLGKYLTPKLYLQYKTQLGSAGLPGLGSMPTPDLSWESGNQLFLEYRINKSWSLSTFYEKERNDKFKIDIKWRHNF